MKDIDWRNMVTDAMLGITFVVTKSGTPVAEVRPIRSKDAQPRFGCARGKIKTADDFNAPLPDFEDYM